MKQECNIGKKQMKTIKFLNDIKSARMYDLLPNYSAEAIDYIYNIFDFNRAIIADIGSGTGKLTYDLLKRGNTVYAVDPDKIMKTVCDEKCGKFKNYKSIDGIDSKTNLADNSIDYVFTAQSFHAFDIIKFKNECNRILKTKNNIIILWNRYDFSKPILF